jgi:hypothetical protein
MIFSTPFNLFSIAVQIDESFYEELMRPSKESKTCSVCMYIMKMIQNKDNQVFKIFFKFLLIIHLKKIAFV